MSYPISSARSRTDLPIAVLLRACAIGGTLAVFFLIGSPIQWLLLKFDSGLSSVLPRLFFRTILRLVKVRVAVCGAKPGKTPPLIVANHISWTDIPALGTIYPVSFLAKREVSTWPIVATFAHLEGTVFVDRSNRKSIVEANAAIAERVRTGACVVLFPEGTTYDGTSLGPFYSSHFGVFEQLFANPPGDSVTVQPVAIHYSSRHAAWIGDDLLLPHIFGLLRGPSVTCWITFCDPLVIAAATDRKTIAQECRQRIAAALLAAEASLPESAA